MPVALRRMFYKSPDRDRCLESYPAERNERAHEGHRTQGRTPYQAFLDGIEPIKKREVKPEVEDPDPLAAA